jgi:hypothetical protein
MHFRYKREGFFTRVLSRLWDDGLLSDRMRSVLALDRAEIYDPLYMAKREASQKGRLI